MDREFGFLLLKNMMQSAFGIDAFYWKADGEWKLNIPSEIEQILLPNYDTSDMRFRYFAEKQNNYLYVTKTNLDFYVIHFFMDVGERSDLVVIGPFRSDMIPIEEFSKKIEEHPFLSSKHRLLLTYYANLPCVSMQKLLDTILCITENYMLPKKSMFPVYTDFSMTFNSYFEPLETKEFLTNTRVDNIDKIVKELKTAILKGDTRTAQLELKSFLNETELLGEKNFLKCKRNLHMVHHTIFMLVYYTQEIYRMDLFRLYEEFMNKIEGIRNEGEAVKIASDVCEAYCMLFQKKLFPEYSKQINDVIHYIHQHLPEKLTLSVLAAQFRIAPSKLSASFKQNTGMTVTAYIQQVRIRQAMDYLHNPVIPVSEIALATGFSDFAYFSKVFKKHTGHSPTEYRERNC